ncbi:MAG: B12-binding domain-containing radical SAM protein [Desulfobacterales bacterium]
MSSVKNILLVYPEIPKNTYWSFKYALSFIGKKSAMPPLGLITVAALFPKNCILKLVDMNVEPLVSADIRWADAVFISAMIVQKKSFAAVVKACNRFKKPVIAGGPYPTTSHQEIAGVDHVLSGEIEEVFSKFFEDFQNGVAKKVYPIPSHPCLSNTPIPRFDLLKMDAYSCMSIQYSRGCPFNCEFCDIWTIYGNRSRVKPAENVIREIDMLYQLGWRNPVFVVDDNFIGNKRRVKKELLPALKQWQEEHEFVYRFFTEAGINLADDDELIDAMRDVGFNEVFIGIETPSKKALRETGKLQNLKSDMLQAVRKLQQKGMEVMGGFVVGFDSDQEDIFDRQIAFIQKAGIPKAMIGILEALPATRLYSRLEKEGRILCDSDGNNTHHMETNFVTRMDRDTLKNGYKKVLETLYDNNLKNYFTRCNICLDHIKNSKLFNRKKYPGKIRILFKSLLYQTFTPYGRQYWKFLFRNIFKNPDKLAEVVRMAIQGHHFRMITQELLKAERVSSALESGYNGL